jgi:tetratricopeptide (TPR) repeat protein
MSVSRDVAVQFLALAEKQKAESPLRRRQAAIGHSFVGVSSFLLGNIAEAREHLEQTIALYNAAEHRTPGTRYGGEDPVVASSFFRSKALWILGYAEAALVDFQQALTNAQTSRNAASLFWALSSSFFFVDSYCGNCAAATARADELVALADEKGAALWKALGIMGRGWLLSMTGRASDAVQMIGSGMNAWRSTGATYLLPSWLSYLAVAYAELGQMDEARRSIGEAMDMIDTSKER